jgi:hypothetical protein
MSRALQAAVAIIAALAAAPAAQACTPLIWTDQETGETYATGSPEHLRREQAAWRAEADAVFIVQAREARMVSEGRIDFLLVPIISLDGRRPPDDAMLVWRWDPGNTCNRFPVALADLLVAYADIEDPRGWSVVGLTVPDQLQDPPPDFARRLRGIRRGAIPGPALPD